MKYTRNIYEASKYKMLYKKGTKKFGCNCWQKIFVGTAD